MGRDCRCFSSAVHHRSEREIIIHTFNRAYLEEASDMKHDAADWQQLLAGGDKLLCAATRAPNIIFLDVFFNDSLN